MLASEAPAGAASADVGPGKLSGAQESEPGVGPSPAPNAGGGMPGPASETTVISAAATESDDDEGAAEGDERPANDDQRPAEDAETTPDMPEDPEKAKKPRRPPGSATSLQYITDKSRRHITFSKRKGGILKKARELCILTGAQVVIAIASEASVYHLATSKLKPLASSEYFRKQLTDILYEEPGAPRSASAVDPASVPAGEVAETGKFVLRTESRKFAHQWQAAAAAGANPAPAAALATPEASMQVAEALHVAEAPQRELALAAAAAAAAGVGMGRGAAFRGGTPVLRGAFVPSAYELAPEAPFAHGPSARRPRPIVPRPIVPRPIVPAMLPLGQNPAPDSETRRRLQHELFPLGPAPVQPPTKAVRPVNLPIAPRELGARGGKEAAEAPPWPVPVFVPHAVSPAASTASLLAPVTTSNGGMEECYAYVPVSVTSRDAPRRVAPPWIHGFVPQGSAVGDAGVARVAPVLHAFPVPLPEGRGAAAPIVTLPPPPSQRLPSTPLLPRPEAPKSQSLAPAGRRPAATVAPASAARATPRRAGKSFSSASVARNKMLHVEPQLPYLSISSMLGMLEAPPPPSSDSLPTSGRVPSRDAVASAPRSA